jgi:hypothetical protein
MSNRIILAHGTLVNLVVIDKSLDFTTVLNGINNFDLLIQNGQNNPTIIQSGAIDTWFEKKTKSQDLTMMIQEKESGEIIGIIEVTDLDTWNKR